MKMKKWRQAAAGLAALCLLLIGLPQPAFAAAQVKVTIPQFPVVLNGKQIDSARSPYPPLLYKNITYLPMTTEYGKALGLDVRWDPITGLSIQSGWPAMPWKDYTTGNNSLTKSYKATVATFPVTVNGVQIDNSKEPYPLLVFRDITYFPMTWRFTHDVFGWETEWDAKTGYRITSGMIPALYEIVSDDADAFYVRGNQGVYKISKKPDGRIALLGESEAQALFERLNEEAEAHALPAGEDATASLEEREGMLFYLGKKLLSLAPYQEAVDAFVRQNPERENETGMVYYGKMIHLDENLSLLQVSVYYMMHIPAPYTPHEAHVFVLHKDGIGIIEGFSVFPQQFYRNPDGSYWLSKPAILPEYVTARNYQEAQGLLALIRPDGTSMLINKQLDVLNVDLLDVSDQGVATFTASNVRALEGQASEKDGIYIMDTRLNARKLTDAVKGRAYVGQDGQIYMLDQENNSITQVTAK